MMFTSIVIEGATYQPETTLLLGSFHIVPATEEKGALRVNECRVVLVSEKQLKEIASEAQLFVFCYQFLLLRTDAYYFFSLPDNPKCSTEDEVELSTVIKKYEGHGACEINFDEIDFFYTDLPVKINFKKFYNQFSEKYTADDGFRNVIDLYLYTVGSKPKFYNNVFQKISQLQTIFETISGTPEQKEMACGKPHLTEEWRLFLTRKLKELGMLDDEEINFAIKIKNTLNWSARVGYIHRSEHMDTWQKTMEELRSGSLYGGQSEYTTDLKKVLDGSFKPDDWTGMDWDNIYFVYQILVKRLIFLKYLS